MPLVQELSRLEKQKSENISRLMASKYLEQMAHDKHFLISLCKDERLTSANKKGSKILHELANKARCDIEKRQAVLRERRPLYAARAAEAAARARLSRARKERLGHAQKQHAVDARRLIQTAKAIFEEHDLARCLEAAEFAMEQITRKPANLLPEKEKYLLELYDFVAHVFLDQCVNVSTEGEVGSTEALLEKREKEMIRLMQDDDLRSAAKHLFKRMSVIPASR
ncbi:unnamed protein product [Parnassius apollo]|uniref:(apollo) hypothetical protein n=1 Tax=Parnassius apollo TaxID=110799 RepID=A0A8S3Y2B7_PARAO|nr:unnamed protein product [Parnassius apollo]